LLISTSTWPGWGGARCDIPEPAERKKLLAKQGFSDPGYFVFRLPQIKPEESRPADNRSRWLSPSTACWFSGLDNATTGRTALASLATRQQLLAADPVKYRQLGSRSGHTRQGGAYDFGGRSGRGSSALLVLPLVSRVKAAADLDLRGSGL
jgi:hypothetical protein